MAVINIILACCCFLGVSVYQSLAGEGVSEKMFDLETINEACISYKVNVSTRPNNVRLVYNKYKSDMEIKDVKSIWRSPEVPYWCEYTIEYEDGSQTWRNFGFTTERWYAKKGCSGTMQVTECDPTHDAFDPASSIPGVHASGPPLPGGRASMTGDRSNQRSDTLASVNQDHLRQENGGSWMDFSSLGGERLPWL